ncbi:unnamed protein product [Mortierella alpina]
MPPTRLPQQAHWSLPPQNHHQTHGLPSCNTDQSACPWKEQRRDERDAKSLMNRLKSIQADAAFVSEITDLFPQFPILANERCGTWYVHPSKIHKPGVYFKSTDGHTGIWDFNLRRYNPHLITTIINHGGCIIVDSTRKGKRVPDALSKTIPIWCATINNAVRKCALSNQAKELQQHHRERTEEPGQKTKGAHAALNPSSPDSALNPSEGEDYGDVYDSSMLRVPALDAERWDTRYHSLPSLISRSEHAQIADKIDGFAEKLMRFTDMTPLTTRLQKPIRPIWLTPQSFLLKDDLPDYSQVKFLPVICLSASRVVQEGMEERDGYLYVQGSGDDEEMWAKGLRPDLFWDNENYLLEDGITAEECEKRASEVVREAKRKQLEKSTHRPKEGITERSAEGNQPLFTPSMELLSEIKPSPIWIGNHASGRMPECWDAGFDMVINCGLEIKRDPRFEWQADTVREHITVLGTTSQQGEHATLCKLQRHQWEVASSPSSSSEAGEANGIPARNQEGQDFYYLHLPIAEGKKGQHQLLEMIPVAIQAVQQLYAARAEAIYPQEAPPSPKILVHCQQGMDRSVGIALALLVSCFNEITGAYCDANALQPATATKEVIQRRLFQVMSHRLAARPSRATLKMVNTYFMSPADPPPAKYKQ